MNENKLKLLRVISALEEVYDFRNNTVKYTIEGRFKNKSKFCEVNLNDLVIKLADKRIQATINEVKLYLGSSKIEKYNPILNYFLECHEKFKKYNQRGYINKFLDYIKTDDQDRFINQFTKWFVRAIKCSIDERYFNKQALVLVSSGKQNLGKTSLTRFLLPDRLKIYYVENPKLDKDGEIALSSYFLIIMDDLGNMGSADLQNYKSSMSRLLVNVRHPYTERPQMSPRRASFIGTTDNYEFLSGENMSVRWLCFDVLEIDWAYSDNVDIDLVWGEAYEMYLNGFNCEVTKDELIQNEKSNIKYKVQTIEYEMIQKYFQPGSEDDYDKILMSSEILCDLQQKTFMKFNDKKIGQALRLLGFNPVNKRNHTNSNGEIINDARRVYFIKYLLTT